MCSYAVQTEIERLSFVEQANLDLNTNIAKVTFKPDQKVSIKELADAVSKAGFSVGYTEADYIFDQLSISNQSTFTYQGEEYQFIKPSQFLLNGRTTLKFLDKKLTSKKTYSFWAPLIKESLKQTNSSSQIIYHVTL
jgi:hypothetical protein